MVNVEAIRRVAVLEERGHLGGIAVPGRVHRERAGMRDRVGDAEGVSQLLSSRWLALPPE